MRIVAVELRRVGLPLVAPLRTSAADHVRRDVLLVRVVGSDTEGWGECAAPVDPTYTAEYTAGAHDVVRRCLAPRLLAADDVTGSAVGPLLSGVRGHRMAKAALEGAVLDAELRLGGVSLAAYLGAVRPRVDAGVSVGIAPSVPELLMTVAEHVDAGYRRVKLKIAPGWDVQPVRAVRERFGDRLQLQVDANGAYTLADAERLLALDAFDLLVVEQPLPADDLVGHAALGELMATPIGLDESIESVADVETALALGACAAVSIKPGRVGGYLEARRIHDVCVTHEVPAFCGGMLETGIGRAAALALAALPGFTLPADLSASDRYYEEDLTEPFVLDDGHLAVPAGPGIGVVPRTEVVERCTTAHETVTA